MRKGKFFHLLTIAFFVLYSGVFAQEKLVSVSGYPELKATGAQKSFKTGGPGTLSLPFLDDFSAGNPLPDPLKWADQKAFINNSFASKQPTYGVATLDMIDSTGLVYLTAKTTPFLADNLTSAPINLYFPQDTTIYLSFYYQPQGLGDAPEPGDSLVVEFYAPVSNEWIRVWGSDGGALQDFRLAMINIRDSRFLQDGFRFRFRNYASLAPSYEASLKVNADHWNIDYVYLDKERRYNDIVMPDFALVQPVGSLLENYTAMPWEHFSMIGITAVRTLFQLNMQNLSLDRRGFTPTFRIQSVNQSAAKYDLTLATDEIKAMETLAYDASFNYGFSSTERDSAIFNVTLSLNQLNPDWIPGNDQVTTQQVFRDYYAYDDGTAEAGYGLVGEGSKNARLAYRCHNTNPGDSLVAVDLYFNQSFDEASKKYFKLAVWNDDNNKPGALLHSQEGGIPKYEGIGVFQRIMLDTAQVVGGTYYIGWIQTTADFLNIGFDKQNDHGSDIFYNLSGTWVSSSYKGSLMIRPVFANKSRKSGIAEDPALNGTSGLIKIYPVPADEKILLDYSQTIGEVKVNLTDMQGRRVRSLASNSPVRELYTADLPAGVYVISVESGNYMLLRQKLTILHD
jgi:hypothetical protein